MGRAATRAYLWSCEELFGDGSASRAVDGEAGRARRLVGGTEGSG